MISQQITLSRVNWATAIDTAAAVTYAEQFTAIIRQGERRRQIAVRERAAVAARPRRFRYNVVRDKRGVISERSVGRSRKQSTVQLQIAGRRHRGRKQRYGADSNCAIADPWSPSAPCAVVE